MSYTKKSNLSYMRMRMRNLVDPLIERIEEYFHSVETHCKDILHRLAWVPGNETPTVLTGPHVNKVGMHSCYFFRKHC